MISTGEYWQFLSRFWDSVEYFINDYIFTFDGVNFPVAIFISLCVIGFGMYIIKRTLFE